jgi:hypothetical protein
MDLHSIRALTGLPPTGTDFAQGDVAEWLKAAVC